MKNKLLLLILVVITCKVFSQEFFYCNEHFRFYSYDEKNYNSYVLTFTEAYDDLTDLFGQERNHLIEIFIFPDQREFIEKVFGYYESKVTSVGMAVKGEDSIYITSFYDRNTGRDFNEYLKVAKHELVHTLLNHEKAWLSEGLALYCADQVRIFDTMPTSYYEMSEYLEHDYYFREAYAYYYWFSGYLIQKVGFNKYLQFFKSDCNWEIIGCSDQDEFCRDAFNALISRSVNK